MRVIAIACALLLAAVVIPGLAQTQAADEKAIRDIVAKMNAGEQSLNLKPMPGLIFWNGPMVKPAVGEETRQMRPGSAAVPGGRTDGRTTTAIVKLEIAASGDMAYEYSTFRSSFVRTSDKQKMEFDGAVLRVWRKVDGQWRIAANFTRPYDDSPTPR